MEYLLGLLTELLPEAAFACENPGYQKMPKLLSSRRRPTYAIPLDGEGISASALEKSAADIVLTTPARQFPVGITMSIGRRQQLLKWALADEKRYLIEDDFDSEFRFMLRPIPTLCSLDRSASKVIYMNSFAKTLTPSLRIAYMVLPEKLIKEYEEMMSFYSCTVSEFEQRIILTFLKGGYYERHLNRMRNVYRKRRDSFIEGLSPLGDRLEVSGQEAGLHLLLKIEGKSENELTALAQNEGVQVYPLTEYYWKSPIESSTVIAGYAGYSDEELQYAAELLVRAWG
jgi:GntR family transcriptional regulator/MocR family aminotransferase